MGNHGKARKTMGQTGDFPQISLDKSVDKIMSYQRYFSYNNCYIQDSL